MPKTFDTTMGEFMRTYLPGVRNRDKDTIDSYRYSINLFVTFLEQNIDAQSPSSSGRG